MSIFNFIGKLLPRIERANVAEDLRVTEKEWLNVVAPSWTAAETYFKINKPKSKEALDMSAIFYQNFDLKRAAKAPNFILEITRRLPVFYDNLQAVREFVNEYLEPDIIAEGLTSKSAFVLRSASNMSLVSRYMLSLLNYLYTVEAADSKTELDPALSICKAEQKYVVTYYPVFVKLFSQYTTPNKDFKLLLGKIPEVYVSSKNEDAVVGLHGFTIDPFASGGVSGFIGNPIYSIRLVIASWQNSRYEAAKTKKQQLELRLLYLEMQQKEQYDASVVKEIEILQTRIENLDRDLREVDEKLGLDN